MNLAVVSLFAFIHYTTVAADTTSLLENHLKTIRLESTPQPLTLSNIENTDITPFMVNAPKTPKGPRGPPT